MFAETYGGNLQSEDFGLVGNDFTKDLLWVEEDWRKKWCGGLGTLGKTDLRKVSRL